MQTTICEVCLKSDILCSVCKEKLDKGIVKNIEIEVGRFLFNLSEKVKSLKDVKINNIIDSEVLLIITKRGDAAKLVGKKGAVVKTLAKRFKKSVRIVEEAEDFRKFVEQLISPTTISGVNTLYTPLGEIYRIRIPPEQKNMLYLSPESFSAIMENIYKCKAEIVFES